MGPGPPAPLQKVPRPLVPERTCAYSSSPTLPGRVAERRGWAAYRPLGEVMSKLDHHADRRWRATHARAERHWLAEHAASAASLESHPLEPDATQRVDLVGTIAFHQVFEVARYLHDCITAGTSRFIVDV